MKTALPPIVFPDSKILILGTMPGEKSLVKQQYYANRGNHFWKILFAVFDEPFAEDYSKRIDLLKKHNIALWDVLSSCERHGSLDSNIKNEIPNDFEGFFERHPQITNVFFSSKAAATYYDKFAVRKIGVIYKTLPSPSGANANMTFLQKFDAWKTAFQPEVS